MDGRPSHVEINRLWTMVRVEDGRLAQFRSKEAEAAAAETAAAAAGAMAAAAAAQ